MEILASSSCATVKQNIHLTISNKKNYFKVRHHKKNLKDEVAMHAAVIAKPSRRQNYSFIYEIFYNPHTKV